MSPEGKVCLTVPPVDQMPTAEERRVSGESQIKKIEEDVRHSNPITSGQVGELFIVPLT